MNRKNYIEKMKNAKDGEVITAPFALTEVEVTDIYNTLNPVIKSLNWFKIEGKWYNCQVVKNNDKFDHYIDGVFSHSVSIPSTKKL